MVKQVFNIYFCVFAEGASEIRQDDKCDSCACDLTNLRKHVKEQGDEIVVLKSALADALRRLQVLEERKHTTGKYLPI